MSSTLPFARRILLLALLGLCAAWPPRSAPAQTPAPPAKPRLAIRTIAATSAVLAQAEADGAANALAQVEQGADPQLMDAMQSTGRFELVARADLPSILKEQDLSQSGNADAMDPQAARAFRLAGARYVATVTIGNFQEIVERTEVLNQFGTAKAERRTIELTATVKVFDSTLGTMLASKAVDVSESAVNEILPGVEQKGRKTNVALAAAARRLATDAASAIAGAVPPAVPTAQPAGGPAVAAASSPLRMAIFVKQRPAAVPAEKVAVFEDLVTAASTAPGIEIIRREDVVNAVNRLAPGGANAGTGTVDSEAVDRLLSDRTSAVQLAAQMRADLVLTASITALQPAKRRLADPATGTATVVDQWTLVSTYGILDGASGASLAAGTVQSDFAKRDAPGLQVEVDHVDPLLRDAADRLGAAVRATAESGRIRAAAAGAEVQVGFEAVLADLSVPDVRQAKTGEYVVGANLYPLEPMNVQVEIDGMAVGAAPAKVPLRPGVHRARLSRPGLEPVELVINAREGLVVSVPMQLSPQGRENWRRDAQFFNELKNGAVLRDADLIKVRGVADFLRQSNIRLDTGSVQNLNLGGESLWWQLLR